MRQPQQCLKYVWNIATLNEVEWITKKRFGRRNFTRIKTKQNRQNLQVSSFLMKSNKPLGCLISKLWASLLTYILIYISKDAHFHFWFWMPLLSKPIYYPVLVYAGLVCPALVDSPLRPKQVDPARLTVQKRGLIIKSVLLCCDVITDTNLAFSCKAGHLYRLCI